MELLEQILTGVYPDGLGNTKNVPDRIDFDPFPYHSMAIWILTQMKRWGHLKGDVNYKSVAEQVYRAADCDRIAKELGYATHQSTTAKHVIMGKNLILTTLMPMRRVSKFTAWPKEKRWNR